MAESEKKTGKRKKFEVPVIEQNSRNVGRPTDYTKELGDWVCEIVAITPEGISRICEMYEGFPTQPTIDRWRYRNEEFRLNYAKSKVIQANLLAEDTLEIARARGRDYEVDIDGECVLVPGNISRDILIINTQKWIAGKLVPKIYGKDVELQQKTEENALLKAEIEALRGRLNMEYKKDY